MTLKSFGIDDEKEFSYELQLSAKFENARVLSDTYNSKSIPNLSSLQSIKTHKRKFFIKATIEE